MACRITCFRNSWCCRLKVHSGDVVRASVGGWYWWMFVRSTERFSAVELGGARFCSVSLADGGAKCCWFGGVIVIEGYCFWCMYVTLKM
jgi:hypothetical protein